jgi:hypothetical protein
MVERDEKGRFKKGASGNPRGRPARDRERRYLEIAKTAVTFEQWRGIIKAAADDALAGDAQARRFLADYLIGPPGKLRERADADEQAPVVVENMSDVVKALAGALADVGHFENHPQKAALVAQLGDKLIKALEFAELADRVEAIERALKLKEKPE